ncbi:MAG: hypothetical protein U0670_16630 [Anaerolineae bacterium]
MNVVTIFLLAVLSFAAQTDPDSWEVLSVRPVGSYGSAFGDNYELSPDDSAIAWVVDGRELCLYARETKITRCFHAPYEVWRLRWSPDSSAILLIEGTRYNAALQVFDRTSEQFTLLEGDHRVDSAARWSASGATVYFLSAGYRAVDEATPFLIAYSVHAQTYTRTDLCGIFPPVPMNQVTLEAVSSTGDQLFVSTQQIMPDGTAAGLWRIDLHRRTLKQIALLRDLYPLLPPPYSDYSEVYGEITGTYWDQDDHALRVMLGDGLPIRTVGIVSIDLETFRQTAVIPPADAVDFSSGWFYNSPFITDDGALIFYFETDPKTGYSESIRAIPLDSPSSTPITILEGVRADCGPTYVLITALHQGEIRTYLYAFGQICVG